MTPMTGREEFEQIKEKLWAGIDALIDANPTDASLQYWSDKMSDELSSVRSLDVLRVYDKLMLEEKNVRSFYWLQMAVSIMSKSVEGPIAPVFTQEHIDRLTGFDRAMFKAENGMFPESKGYQEHREYLQTMQATAVICDADSYEYLITNMITVSSLTMERGISDAKLLGEMLKVMATGSNALVSGAL